MVAKETVRFCLIAFLAVLQGSPSYGDAQRSERWDRSVDVVALSAQTKAIAKYRKLIRKYRKTSRERSLRMLMLEAMEHATNLEFRIAHGDANLKKRPVNYKNYHRRLRDVIQTATAIVRQAPKAEDSVRIYYVRAQAQTELKKIGLAQKDYDFITKHYPQTPWAVKANLALAGFATDAGLHRVAVSRLKEAEKFPDDPHYPFVLYKMAWAHFNLEDIPQATGYLVRHIRYYQKKERDDGAIAESEKVAIQTSQKDYVLFFFEGFEKAIGGYTLNDALSSFKDLDPGDYLGRMIIEFANLLRSREKAEALTWWQNEIIDEETDRPEALGVIIVNVEFLLQKKKYEALVNAAKSFHRLDEETDKKVRLLDDYPRAQNLVLKSANQLHKLIAAAKDRKKSLALSRTLAGTYDAFVAMVEESDPRLQKVHYNLGETLFSIKEYDAATEQYVWVLKHWSEKAGLKRDEISLKAISSLYQRLLTEKRFPKELSPKKLSEDNDVNLDDIEQPMGTWIGWVDDYISEFGRKPKSIYQFEFDSHRVLYSEGQTRVAVKRMLEQVKANPQAKNAQQAASLILDTYVFDKQWELLLEASEQFLATRKLGDKAFRKRLEPMPADASFKLLELAYKNERFEETVERAERFEEKYRSSKRTSNVLYLASRASEKIGKPKISIHYLNELLRRYPKDEDRAVALLARASLAEETFDFDSAARDYRAYLNALSSKKGQEKLVKQLLLVNWLSRKPSQVDCGEVATPQGLDKECDRFTAMLELAQNKTGYSRSTLIEYGKSRRYKDNRAIWAAVALKFVGTEPRTYFYNRISLMERLAQGFPEQEPLHRLVLVPALNNEIPRVFTSARKLIPRAAPVRSSEAALAKRIELIKRLEKAATRIVELPWTRVKISVLHEVAQAYSDFSVELRKLPKPKGASPEELQAYTNGLNEMLTLFDNKGAQISAQVADLAREFPVGPNEVPGLFQGRALASQPKPITVNLIKEALGEPRHELYDKWHQAVQDASWARAAFFFSQVKKKKIVPEGTLALMRSISLYKSGARPEAVKELEAAIAEIGNGETVLQEVVRSQYANSSAAKKVTK